MAKAKNSILDSLNLFGLTPSVKLEAVNIGAEAVDLGPLKTLHGTWKGTGFNLIELPNMNQAKPGPPPHDKFRVMLNAYDETLTFSPIGGEIPNRGNAQKDIFFKGLHYLQQVSDSFTKEGIHLETGLFLNLPSSTDPQAIPSVARLGSIPHGDSLLAQGKFFTVNGGPLFEVADSTPFRIVNGKRVNDTSPEYLSLLNNAVPPTGIPKEAIMNPNILLQNAIKGQKIINTIVIFLDANPIDGVSNVGPTPTVGGITNIPFVEVNANASTLTAIFWIETVQNADGSTFLQLQYTQTVILDFPVFGPPPANAVTPIKWPHISVATLRLQPE
jgi:hypothetical protein